jgi:hypothetical protein
VTCTPKLVRFKIKSFSPSDLKYLDGNNVNFKILWVIQIDVLEVLLQSAPFKNQFVLRI